MQLKAGKEGKVWWNKHMPDGICLNVRRCKPALSGDPPPGPATVGRTVLMRERAGTGNAVINTWPQSRFLDTFSLSDSFLLCRFIANPSNPIIPLHRVGLCSSLPLTHKKHERVPL